MRCKILAVLVLLSALVPASEGAAEPGAQHRVRISGAIYLGDLPTYVADGRGLFAEHGLDATVDYGESGKGNLERLRAGETDFALMALTPLVLDRLADATPGQPDDPVIIASLLQSHELTAVFAAPDSGIVQPQDLRGRRIAFQRGSNTEFVWWLFAQYHGIDTSAVETVSIPFAETAEALISGRADAAVLPEPWASELEARLKRRQDNPPRRFKTQNLYAGRWVIVTSRRHVDARLEACRNVLAAYRQAIEFIERAPGDAIAIYNRGDGTEERLVAARWEALDYGINLDWALIASLQEQFRWARDVGIANAAGPVQVMDLLAPEPLLLAWPDAVRVPVARPKDGTP